MLNLDGQRRADWSERERNQLREALVLAFAILTEAQKWQAVARAAQETWDSCAVLLRALTDVQRQDVLVRAAGVGDAALLERALAAGADPNAPVPPALQDMGLAGVTTLVAGVVGGHTGALGLLLDAGADTEKSGPLLGTPLVAVVCSKCATCVQRLL